MEQTIVTEIAHIDQLLQGKKFLLVKSRSYDSLAARSHFDGLDHVEFSGFTPNPLYEQV